MGRDPALPDAGTPAGPGLLTEIARRYFIDNETQDTIGRALGLSRMKVNRLLREAQDAGLGGIAQGEGHEAASTHVAAGPAAVAERVGIFPLQCMRLLGGFIA